MKLKDNLKKVAVELQCEETHTPRISPKLGLLGFLGFLGFFGIYTYQAVGQYFPFLFFVFFGFFGFFYDGKMSRTLRDERFKHNELRAKAKSRGIGFGLTYVCLIVVCAGNRSHSMESDFLFLLIALSLICGLTIFLNEYLLYRYDNEE